MYPALLVLLQVKCDQYWPARGTETYGLIQVTLLDTVELATYTVRTFALHKVWPCPGACAPYPSQVLKGMLLSMACWGWASGNLGCGVQRCVSALCRPALGYSALSLWQADSLRLTVSPHPPFSPERLQ